MSEKPRFTFHYTPAEYFANMDPTHDYVPPHFSEEGFIHTTEGAQNLAEVGNRYYRDDLGQFLVLYIEKARVKSPIKYEDLEEIYPHIYGPLNRDAIVAVRPAPRKADGSFLPVPELPE